MDDWADRAKTQAYYLDEQGNLAYDAERAAMIPDEDYVPPYTAEQCEQLGIAQRDHSHAIKDMSDYKLGNGCLKLGGASIRVGKISGLSVGKSAANATINFNASDFAGFAGAPVLTVTPYCEETSGAGYGIFAYIKSLSATSATVRLTSNYIASDLSVGLCWMAIGATN